MFTLENLDNFLPQDGQLAFHDFRKAVGISIFLLRKVKHTPFL